MVNTLENVLVFNGLSSDILSRLSYKTELGRSLKNSLRHFDRQSLVEELCSYTEWLNEQSVWEEVSLDYRIKSIDSLIMKYERYYPNRQVFKTFNDVLGFRAFCDDYSILLNACDKLYRVVDMTQGKSNDDGYRGVHIYYQKDNFHYPIEIQFNTYYDRQLNNWLHDYLYKKDYPIAVGTKMRNQYEKGIIRNKADFEKELNHVLSCGKRC